MRAREFLLHHTGEKFVVNFHICCNCRDGLKERTRKLAGIHTVLPPAEQEKSVYIYIHMYIYACLYVCMYTHIYIVYVCNQNTMIHNEGDTKLKTECLRVNQFCAAASLLTDTHKYAQTHSHTRTPTHAHTHTHAPTHTYTHTHTLICTLEPPPPNGTSSLPMYIAIKCVKIGIQPGIVVNPPHLSCNPAPTYICRG